MPFPAVCKLRRRAPAFFLAAVLNLAVVALFLRAVRTDFVTYPEETTETKISLLPERSPPPPVPEKRLRRRAEGGGNAITIVNPDAFTPSMLPLPEAVQRLNMALGACAPEKYDKASYEVRHACDRLGQLVADDPGRFGVDPGFVNGKRWGRELLIKQTPLLLPCMSRDVNILYTLICAADVLWNGYDPDKMQTYKK